MTTITFKKQDMASNCFDTISINGRKQLAQKITSIKKVGIGKWVGQARGYDFTIFGGRDAGGASNEWFVQWTLDGEHDFIKYDSAKAAINHIELA